MTIENIPVVQLALAFVPVAIVIAIMWRWRLEYSKAVYGVARMLLQLILIGYVLIFIFDADSSPIVVAVLTVMVVVSSWIAISSVGLANRSIYLASLAAIFTGGGINLVLVTQGVLQLEPWYLPRYMIPLAGMVFANAMTSVSLAAERLHSELGNGHGLDTARHMAFQAALIPVINSLFAVGLVSLPGMMTGQILSGVSPFIAARYQIMVMCMIFASAGLASAIFLRLWKPDTGES